MSGGHWDYLAFKLEERADFAGPVWKLIARLEHELDWGYSGDTCLECAERTVAKALAAFFDGGADGIEKALEVARSRDYSCVRHSTGAAERMAEAIWINEGYSRDHAGWLAAIESNLLSVEHARAGARAALEATRGGDA